MASAGQAKSHGQDEARLASRNLIADDGYPLVTRFMAAAAPVRGTAYVAHGQAHHSLNLIGAMAGLAGRGWNVHATDLRGHGQSTSAGAPLAHLPIGTGWERLAGDLRHALQAAFDGVPWDKRLVIAPNIAAPLVLEVLRDWPDLAARIVMVAPPSNNVAVLRLARAFMAVRIRQRPAAAPDPLTLHQLYTFLGAQLPDRKELIDVVSSDRAVTDALLADPLAWPTPTTGYFHEMFRGIDHAWATTGKQKVRQGTRVLLLYGSEDPVTASGRFIPSVRDHMARIGSADVACIRIAGGRSGLLLEEARFGLSRQITDWAGGMAAVPDTAQPVTAPAAGDTSAGVLRDVLGRLGVVDTGPALTDDALVALCYHAIDDQTRGEELLYRIASALATEGDLSGERLQATIAALMPHWERSHAINAQIAQAAAVGTVMQNVIDRFGIGLAIVDADLGIVFANAAFAAALGIVDPNGPSARARMQEHLHAMADARFLALVRQGAKEALMVRDGVAAGLYFRPPSLRQTTLERGGASGVVVIRRSTDRDLVTTIPDMLQFAYGLTPKEAETAMGMMNGHSAETIATQMDVSINTVRTHLKRIYEKLGVRTQGELVARLLRGPIGLLSGRLDH